MNQSRHAPVALSLAALLAYLPVLGDEIHDQLDAARTAYDDGDLRGSAEALQFALTKIQEQMTAKLQELLPDPLPGWEADDPQSQSAGILTAIAGTNLSRTYSRDDGADVEISITADSPMIGMMNMMFASPFLVQATPGTSAFTERGYRGLIEHGEGSSDWEMKLMVGDRTFLQLTGRGLESDEPLRAYLEAMDLAAIEKAIAH